MPNRFYCKSEKRRQAAREHPDFNGIDYLEVVDQDAPSGSPRQRTLLVRTVDPLPAGLDADNVRIEGGVRVGPIQVEWAAPATDADALLAAGLISGAERNFLLAHPEPDHLLVARTDSEGDYSTYRLRLVEDGAPHSDFDPLLSEVDFSFKVECPSEFDCAPETDCPPEPFETPVIDYLAKDYASFRRLMLDRLSVLMPDWRDRSPADLQVTLVELLAHAADLASYHQDAVGGEAYLGTARRRISVRRHARLLDYRLHEGSNARVWVHFQVNDLADGVTVTAEGPTRLLTRVPDTPPAFPPGNFEKIRAAHRPEVFELLHDVTLFKAHNELAFYTWGDQECCLPRGAVQATLAGRLENLRVGDVLIFEEVLGPLTGVAPDADPAHRQAVRLTGVEETEDKLGGRFLETPDNNPVPVTNIEWGAEDALRFPLCVSTRIEVEGEEVLIENVSVARGNVAPADHGRTLAGESVTITPWERRPRLAEPDITHRVPFDVAAWAEANPESESFESAARAQQQLPAEALPAVQLASGDEDWNPQLDLLGSDRFDTHFVVEMENEGRGRLRFGDNIFGKRPLQGQAFEATYRTGNGTRGNVGAGAIAHLASSVEGIEEVRNPLAALGGTEQERLEEARQYAPWAFRRQERAVTEADYAEVSERHPEVDKAVARRRWTGSWHTMFVTADRVGGLPVDTPFESRLTDWVDGFKLAGHDVEIEPPISVPLDIAFTVCVKAGYVRADIKEALLETFSNRDLPDGRLGFFHPDRFTFGQPVYLSEVVSTAMEVPGVRWVEFRKKGSHPSRFHRYAEKERGEIEAGLIEIDRLEIARLDNDLNAPENGKIEFHMEGGL